MPFTTRLTLLAGLLSLAGSLSAHAQFDPGPNPITGAETGQRSLDGGTGTITGTGSLTLDTGGGSDLIEMDGEDTVLSNAGTISRAGGSGGSLAVSILGDADDVTITNSGTIENTGDGRAIRSDDGAGGVTTINNSGTISAAADDAIKFDDSELAITNSGSITAVGGQALDLGDIETENNTVTNLSGGLIQATGADALRPGVNGVVLNNGTIQAIPVPDPDELPALAITGSDGIDTGERSGVQVTNSGLIQGRHGVTGGIEDEGDGPYTITVINQDGGSIQAVNGSGVNIDGLFTNAGATVTNAEGGVIQGNVDDFSDNGDGDGVDVDGVVSLTNSGDVLGYGAKGVDSGGLPNNAEGVAAGGGTIINTATGRIIGSTDLADAPNGDPTRQGRGILIDDGSGGSGVAATTVTNSGLIQGKNSFAVKFVGDFADTITNEAGGTLQGAGSSYVVQMGEGNDTLNNSGTILHDANTMAVDMEAGDDIVNITGSSPTVTGNMTGGSGNDTLNIDLDAGGTFNFTGTITSFETINANSGDTVITGTHTVGDGHFLNVNGTFDATSLVIGDGGKLGGTGQVDAMTTVESGGMLAPGSSPGQFEFTDGLVLEGGSLIQFELSSLGTSDLVTVSGGTLDLEGGMIEIIDLGVFGGGEEFVLFDYVGATLAGDVANMTLLLDNGWVAELVNDSDNSQVVLQVTAVPEPTGGALLLVGAGYFLLRRRRAA